jgi:hypothetical protein
MAMLGSILYSQVLARPVPGAVRLQAEGEELFLRCKLVGDPSVVAKLNGDKALVKRVSKFVRGHYQLGDKTISSRRFFSLAPFESGSLLSVSTMPRSKWWGMASSFDVGEFQHIARAVEALL